MALCKLGLPVTSLPSSPLFSMHFIRATLVLLPSLRHSRFFPTSWYFALPSAQNRILAQISAWPSSLSLSNQCPFRELLWWSFLRWCPLPPHQLLPPHLDLLHSTSQMTFYYMLFISFVSLACMGSLWSQSCLLLHSSTRMQWALSKYLWMNGWMSEWPTIDPTHSHKILKMRM